MTPFNVLDRGLDGMAAGARANFWPRVLSTLCVAAIALAFLAWPICAAWATAVCAIETLGWFATRDQAQGHEVGVPARLLYAGTVVGGVVCWTLLGVLFWRLGSAAGALCGVIIWTAILGFAQVHAYQSRVGYLLTSVLPAAALLIVPLVSPSLALAPGLAGARPVWFLLITAVTFALSGARQTAVARQRFDEATRELRERESSYRLLADNITDVIALASETNQRLYVSPSIERILGFTPGELLVTPNYAYMHPEDVESVQAFIALVTVETGPQTLDYRVFDRHGGVIWAETTFSRLGDGSGRILSVSRDVTQRKALEEELKDALAHAEGTAAAKTDFLANMTHELRTPLTAIIGFAGVLRQSKELSAQDARHAGLIHDASQTLLGVVGDVLDYSKLEAGAFELNLEPFDPIAAAHAAVAIVAEQAAEKGLELTTHFDEATPAVIGDAPRLRQVLLNFLSNAIKFTREGGVELSLAQWVEAGRCRLRIEVKDSGIGIDAAHMSSLFTRFTQADASVSRRFGGTGLGLAISKQIIEAMQGRIGAESVGGQGSTFWLEVELPLAGDWTVSAEPDAPGVSLDRPIRALVVEDNAVNRELIATLLSPFDIEIDTACDGAEALQAVGHRRYDVILMDLQMPVMDGLTATQRIRGLADRDVAATPIIAMTANVLPEHVTRCREAGMDDHIGKPINLTRLLQAIDRWSAPDAREARAGRVDAAAVS